MKEAMKELPDPIIYEQEFKFMPWGSLINNILTIIEKESPRNASVLDLMCGPGYLLSEIGKKRNDLVLEGTDINNEFLKYAQSKYPNISFQTADVLSWHYAKKHDVILCTGGIHHLPYGKQMPFLEKIPAALNANGFAIFADPYIDNYSNELERRQAAARLGYEYMMATIKNGAPDDVIKATIDILYNDVMGFEYKTSLKKIEPVFRRLFSQLEIRKTWPEFDSEFGDYYIIGRNRKDVNP